MTYKEAKEILLVATYSDEWQGNEELTTAHLMAMDAVIKQIPEKPNFIGDGYADGEMVYDEYECPNCGNVYELECDGELKHCHECGQTLDWSEEE